MILTHYSNSWVTQLFIVSFLEEFFRNLVLSSGRVFIYAQGLLYLQSIALIYLFSILGQYCRVESTVYFDTTIM